MKDKENNQKAAQPEDKEQIEEQPKNEEEDEDELEGKVHVDSHGVARKKTYDEQTTKGEIDLSEQTREFNERKTNVRVFDKEELELIASGFKSQLGDVRTAIKNVDILLKKKKFETKKGYLDQYRSGLLADLIIKGERQITIIDEKCI